MTKNKQNFWYFLALVLFISGILRSFEALVELEPEKMQLAAFYLLYPGIYFFQKSEKN